MESDTVELTSAVARGLALVSALAMDLELTSALARGMLVISAASPTLSLVSALTLEDVA